MTRSRILSRAWLHPPRLAPALLLLLLLPALAGAFWSVRGTRTPAANLPPAATIHPTRGGAMASSPSAENGPMEQILFVECGFGADQHGQDVTKAAVRACRNAIEFNSIPSIKKLVPGEYDGMKLRVQLAVPEKYSKGLDLAAVQKVFPYGKMLPIEVQPGGMVASSGIAIKEMGDKNDDMVIVVACVTVGY